MNGARSSEGSGVRGQRGCERRGTASVKYKLIPTNVRRVTSRPTRGLRALPWPPAYSDRSESSIAPHALHRSRR